MQLKKQKPSLFLWSTQRLWLCNTMQGQARTPELAHQWGCHQAQLSVSPLYAMCTHQSDTREQGLLTYTAPTPLLAGISARFPMAHLSLWPCFVFLWLCCLSGEAQKEIRIKLKPFNSSPCINQCHLQVFKVGFEPLDHQVQPLNPSNSILKWLDLI